MVLILVRHKNQQELGGGRQKQVGLCEFKAGLVLQSEFQGSWGYTEKPCLEKQPARAL